MRYELPQFRDYPQPSACDGETLCQAACRAKTKGGEKWRLEQTGKEAFPCPFGKGMGWQTIEEKHQPSVNKKQEVVASSSKPSPSSPAPVKRKAVSATPEEVEERVAIQCDKRIDGQCTACKTCKGTPSCRQVAQWRDCPAGFWKAKSGI